MAKKKTDRHTASHSVGCGQFPEHEAIEIKQNVPFKICITNYYSNLIFHSVRICGQNYLKWLGQG